MDKKSTERLTQLAECLGTGKALESDIERREEELEKIQIRYQQSKNRHADLDMKIRTGSKVMEREELDEALKERREARALIGTIGEELRDAQIALKQLGKRRAALAVEAEGMLESMGADAIASVKRIALAQLDETRAALRLEKAELAGIASKHGLDGAECRQLFDDFEADLGRYRSIFM